MPKMIIEDEAQELSTELAEQLVEPILEVIEIVGSDETARAIITMIRVVACEEDASARASFTDELAMRLYSKTSDFRRAAMAFAA